VTTSTGSVVLIRKSNAWNVNPIPIWRINMKKMLVLSLTLIAITLPLSRSSAQEPAEAPAPDQQPRTRSIQVTSPAGRSDLFGAVQNFNIARHGDPEQMGQFRKAMEAYKSAESESDKALAKKELHGLLVEQYDNSLTRYEEHLNELEKKIATMREQLSRRRDARDEMVELKLQMVVSEAEGLGWPDDGTPNLFFPGAVNGGGAHAGALGFNISPVPPMPVPPMPVAPAQSTAPRPRNR
jgi:hypothetical protein